MSPQIPQGATFFEVFGLPPKPTLDEKALEAKFRELSLQLHPDRLTGASPKQRLLAVEQTATLNDAYRTLKDPVKRAFYLLKLQGIDLDREAPAGDSGPSTELSANGESSPRANGGFQMPMEFLEEMMELRERLDVLGDKKDLAGAQKMAAEVTQRRKDALATAFSALEAGDATKASHELGKVRYFARFLEEVEAMEEEALA